MGVSVALPALRNRATTPDLAPAPHPHRALLRDFAGQPDAKTADALHRARAAEGAVGHVQLSRNGFLPLFPDPAQCVVRAPACWQAAAPVSVCCALLLERSMADATSPPLSGQPAAASAVVSSTYASQRVGAAPAPCSMLCDARGGGSCHGWGAPRGQHWSLSSERGRRVQRADPAPFVVAALTSSTLAPLSHPRQATLCASSTMLCCLSGRRAPCLGRRETHCRWPTNTAPHLPSLLL